MDPEKIAAVKDWPIPTKTRDIQVFLGLANFYRRFIQGFSQICTPLTAILKKGVSFHWDDQANSAFELLKTRITSEPILHHFCADKPCVVETDASDYAIGAVISQYDDDNLLHPIAFYCRKLIAAEVNYQIYDKERGE